MSYVIRCVGWASGKSSQHDGKLLRSYNPEFGSGRGLAMWTANPDLAMKFDDQAEAFALWLTVPTSAPLRADGKPNKPLTAFSIMVELA